MPRETIKHEAPSGTDTRLRADDAPGVLLCEPRDRTLGATHGRGFLSADRAARGFCATLICVHDSIRR